MGNDYALVHLKYTIPLAAALGLLGYPLFTRLDVARTVFIVTIAVLATIPWDSYLIRTQIWSYPPDAVLGPTVFSIPVEELFFFFIQTYITSQLYIILNKPVLHAQHLNSYQTLPRWIPRVKLLGQTFLGVCALLGFWLISSRGVGTYLGLILAWAAPFALLTWSITAHFILVLPLTSTVVPVLLPTIYLWIVDENALGRGTWAIGSGTKLGVRLFGSLEIEEAVFFLVTNLMIVFGLAAFDKAVAVVDAHPDIFDMPSDALSFSLLQARVLSPAKYDMDRIMGIRHACARLQKKSRSFHLASSVFPGRLRIDLTLLYSYCRLADDLVDDAENSTESAEWVEKLHKHLELRYSKPSVLQPGENQASLKYATENFPTASLSGLGLLPAHLLPKRPLDELLEGFKMDLGFDEAAGSFPIANEKDLELYASRVASTVGQLCVELVFHHCCDGPRSEPLTEAQRDSLRRAACRMGLALQYVNIARDIIVDARINRVYLPTTWLKEEGLTPEDVLADPTSAAVEKVRSRLLRVAFEDYHASRTAMQGLPTVARGPMIVAVESYMEIGRVLVERQANSQNVGEKKTQLKPIVGTGKATVPKGRRIWVAWSNLMWS
ncbi:terpene synthase [Plectosphaerella plurivora]|uniref:Bifunctional lycopene cyclase/phytoene synthase n=1 Tax=Plectosphaerella plurivora TaxID=936078 RepID=A0A9P9ADG1_9PEZI|nr:terpene synthase [Plectosphaerella plurivora]